MKDYKIIVEQEHQIAIAHYEVQAKPAADPLGMGIVRGMSQLIIKSSPYVVGSFLYYQQDVSPKAVAIAVRVVRMMFTTTDHLDFFSFVIVLRDFLGEITIQSKDCTTIDEYLRKYIEHAVVYLAWRWQEQGDERHGHSCSK